MIYDGADAKRLDHVADRPRVALHFDGDGSGADIVVFTGDARRADEVPPAHENTAWLARYAAGMVPRSGSIEEFGRRFPVPLRVEITRTRGR